MYLIIEEYNMDPLQPKMKSVMLDHRKAYGIFSKERFYIILYHNELNYNRKIQIDCGASEKLNK